MVTMESPSMGWSPRFVYRSVQVLVVVLAFLLISPVEAYRENGVKKETGVIQNKKMDVGDQFVVAPAPKVPVSTVAWLTLAMAVATGLGAVPFFFVQLEPRWGGICNGVASGVMLAASFDLIQEGQKYGGGSWVVIGILSDHPPHSVNCASEFRRSEHAGCEGGRCAEDDFGGLHHDLTFLW